MSILAQAKKAVEAVSPRQADRLTAWTAGYFNDPLPAGYEGDTELRNDWERGVAAHTRELEKVMRHDH